MPGVVIRKRGVVHFQSCHFGSEVLRFLRVPDRAMKHMKNYGVILFSALTLVGPFAGCQNRPFQTVAIYDDPSRFVRLEVDSTVGGGHSHPVEITTDDMIAILAGVMIEEPPGFMSSVPLLTKDKEPRHHPAFSEAEIRFFAPFIADGLKKAKSEEIVTFGQTSQKTGFIDKHTSGGMFVTSGGIFINADELHLILSNYRSETNYASDPGISGTTLDGRSAPLRSIAPQRTTLYFEPTAAVAPSQEGLLSKLLRPDRREIVILFKKLSRTTSNMGRDQH